MFSRPFNEELLWKGCIQRANYPDPVRKPPMELDQVNSLTGHRTKEILNIYKKVNASYELYSRKYWEGVEKRKKEYRQKNSICLYLDN
jgi:hypothetical protein